MLVFIIPLKSKKFAGSWDNVCRVFERCLKSVCNQTSDKFKVIVVCNEKPNIKFCHDNVEYIKVDFMPPEPCSADKYKKIEIGLVYAQKYNPKYFMHVDADDCVNKNLVEFSEKNPKCDGWYFDSGYIYNEGSKFIFLRKKEFNTICGTCRIIRYKIIKSNKLPLHSHKCTIIYGHKLKPLPFIGSVYIRRHGETMADAQRRWKRKTTMREVIINIKQMRHYRFLTKKLRDEFGVYKIKL